jgi:hypothetical protein
MKQIILISSLIALIMLFPGVVKGQNIAGQSATIQPIIANSSDLSIAREDKKEVQRQVLHTIFQKHNSPFVDEVDTFMSVCEENDLNCYLLPAIAGVESGFGKQTKAGSNNAYGWGGGKITFSSWSEGTQTVGKSIRTKYINRGAVTLDGVGKIYAASPEWSAKVRKMQREFEQEEARYQLYFSYRSVEL